MYTFHLEQILLHHYPYAITRTESIQYNIRYTFNAVTYTVRTYTVAQLNVEKVGRREEQEAGSSLPRSHPPSPNLYTKPCSVRRPTTYNTTATHPSLCHAKEKGKGGGVRTFKETGAVGEQLRTAQQQKRIRSPVSILLPSVGESVGRHTFSSLGSSVPDSLSPPLLPPLLLIRRRRGKGFSASLPLSSSSVHGTTHSLPSPLFPQGFCTVHATPLSSFHFYPPFSLGGRRRGPFHAAAAEEENCQPTPSSPKERGGVPPPQQAPRNRTADGVHESCSRMYGIAAVRAVYCCCGGGQKGEGGWTKGESTLAALQCAA